MAKTILVVDDDALMRRSLAASLGQTGYTVETDRRQRRKAVQSVRRKAPDLVLLDVGLPGMDGMDTLRELRRDDPNLAVILVGSWAATRAADEIVGLEMGADDYITKPFDMDVLLAHIKAVMRRAPRPPRPHPSNAPSVSATSTWTPPHTKHTSASGSSTLRQRSSTCCTPGPKRRARPLVQ